MRSLSEFVFTVTDLARFLGKSAVTLRTWERQGLVEIPRDPGGDRKLTAQEVRDVATVAHKLGRITPRRLDQIACAVIVLQLIEEENSADKNLSNRRTRKR